MPTPIGFIGLGIMGQPMALNLHRAGHPLHLYARRPETLSPLSEQGATIHSSPKELATQVDLIITLVSDGPDVESLLFGPEGICQGAHPGTLIIDMSTIAASTSRQIAMRLAEQQLHFLDAPVSGGQTGAIAGNLSIMVGGEAAQFARALPILNILGQQITHLGPSGSGQIAKTCNQILVSQMLVAVGETLLLAKAAGVDPAAVRQALLGGFANSRILDIHGQRMLDHQFQPGFKTKLHHKDIRIALQTAAELGLALPGTALAAQYFNALMGTGKGELDSSALVLAQEQLSDVHLNDQSPHNYQRSITP